MRSLARPGVSGYAYLVNGSSSPPGRMNGCVIGMASALLGLCLTLSTVLYQREADPNPMCGGNLSAGFPLSFICDDTGGSPVSSWGKIDFADIINIKPRLLLLDFLLDSAALTLAWTVLAGLRKGLAQAEVFRWAVLWCIGYIVAFLFAFLLFQWQALNFEVPAPTTPTPIVYTPTPFGTPPFPDAAPTTSP